MIFNDTTFFWKPSAVALTIFMASNDNRTMYTYTGFEWYRLKKMTVQFNGVRSCWDKEIK